MEKARAWNFACVLAYYPDRSTPLLVKIGSRESRGRWHYFPMNPISYRYWQKGGVHEPCHCHLCLWRSIGIGNFRRQRCLRPYGGISVLLTDVFVLCVAVTQSSLEWRVWACGMCRQSFNLYKLSKFYNEWVTAYVSFHQQGHGEVNVSPTKSSGNWGAGQWLTCMMAVKWLCG